MLRLRSPPTINLGIPGLDMGRTSRQSSDKITNQFPGIEVIIAFDNEQTHRIGGRIIKLFNALADMDGIGKIWIARWKSVKGIDDLWLANQGRK